MTDAKKGGKKRGRKPKNTKKVDKPPPKKRGRKPKGGKIIKNFSINKKKDYKSEIVDYNKYCSDYINKNINNFVINKMKKYKLFFLIKSS